MSEDPAPYGRLNGKEGWRTTCLQCGSVLAKPSRSRKFCNDKCKMLHWKDQTYKKFMGEDGTTLLVRTIKTKS